MLKNRTTSAAPSEACSRLRVVMIRESPFLTHSGHIASPPVKADERSPRICVCPTKNLLTHRIKD